MPVTAMKMNRRALRSIGFLLTLSLASPAAADDGLNVAPWVVAGLGAAAMVGGGVFALLASGAYDDARNDPVQMTAAESLSQGDTLATVGNLLLVSGAVIAVTGIAWGAVDLQGSSGSSEQATLHFGPGAVELRGTF